MDVEVTAKVLKLWMLCTVWDACMQLVLPPISHNNSMAAELEDSPPHSQEPANNPYPEPGESATPPLPNQSP
jgi:hypothetical protein